MIFCCETNTILAKTADKNIVWAIVLLSVVFLAGVSLKGFNGFPLL